MTTKTQNTITKAALSKRIQKVKRTSKATDPEFKAAIEKAAHKLIEEVRQRSFLEENQLRGAMVRLIWSVGDLIEKKPLIHNLINVLCGSDNAELASHIKTQIALEFSKLHSIINECNTVLAPNRDISKADATANSGELQQVAGNSDTALVAASAEFNPVAVVGRKKFIQKNAVRRKNG